MRSVIRSKRLVLPPIRLVASATAIRSAGKNARKRLKGNACEIMLHRGNTRANVRYARRRSLATGFIAGHYTCTGTYTVRFSPPTPRSSTAPARAQDKRVWHHAPAAIASSQPQLLRGPLQPTPEE